MNSQFPNASLFELNRAVFYLYHPFECHPTEIDIEINIEVDIEIEIVSAATVFSTAAAQKMRAFGR